MGHRYWRVWITAVAGFYHAIAEVELRESVGGADQTGAGTASAHNSLYGAPSNAVDNDTGTFWQAFDNSFPAWWKYDFGSGVTKALQEISITPRTGDYNRAPSAFDIEWSDDDSIWESVGSFTHSWADATPQVFAWSPVITPATANIVITESVPAIGVAATSVDLEITGGTPAPGVAFPVAPGSGSITITGGTSVPSVDTSVRPLTVQMRITVQVPVPSWGSSLSVTLPPLSALFNARGLNASLQVTLPAITFVGETSAPGWLAVTLPPISVLLGGGNSLVVDLPMPEVLLNGAVGSIGSLHVDLPSLAFSAAAGSALALDLPPLESLFSGTVGTAGSLHVNLPPFAALFAGRVENKGELVINLPGLQSLFTATQQNLGSLHVDLPPLAALFSGYAGETASLQVTLPALEALFTSYENLTGQMVVVLPALQALFEAAQSGRFDTATALQLDGVILRYRRPV